MKKVLIVVYEFPPYRTSGVYRPVKFVKYLSRFGYKPVVLTVKNHPTDTLDYSLLKEIPDDIKIYKAYSIEPKRWEQKIFNLFFKGGAAPSTQPSSTSLPDENINNGTSFKNLIKKLFLSPLSRFTHNYLYSPDSRIGWKYRAVPTGIKAVRDEKIDLIFSSSPPETNHITAYKISKKTGVPLVVDFRDPWTDNFIRDNDPEYSKIKEKKIEKEILEHASKIVHIGSRFIDLSLSSFPSIDRAKHSAITNGYDEADFSGFNAAEIYRQNKTDYFNILNVGTIYENCGFDSFIKAWEILLEDNAFRETSKLSLIGNLLDSQKAILAGDKISDTVNILGFKKHSEATMLMMSADLLLLMPSGGHEKTRDKIIPGKLFELIRSGRPVLLIGWEGEASEIIMNSGNGMFVDKENIAEIVDCIKKLHGKKSSGELNVNPDWDYIKKFSRENLTERLAKIFDEVVKSD